MYTLESIWNIRCLANELNLERREIFDKYSDLELQTLINGIGPSWFPNAARYTIDTLTPSLVPVAAIHDIEYHEGGGRQEFLDSNNRLYRNGVIVAKAAYAWYDPRRYLVMRIAHKFARLCDVAGWIVWTHPQPGEADYEGA